MKYSQFCAWLMLEGWVARAYHPPRGDTPIYRMYHPTHGAAMWFYKHGRIRLGLVTNGSADVHARSPWQDIGVHSVPLRYMAGLRTCLRKKGLL